MMIDITISNRVKTIINSSSKSYSPKDIPPFQIARAAIAAIASEL